jgi:hypothetical protein
MFIINEWLIITQNIKTKARRGRVIIVQNTCEQLGSFTCNIKENTFQVSSTSTHLTLELFICCLSQVYLTTLLKHTLSENNEFSRTETRSSSSLRFCPQQWSNCENLSETVSAMAKI